MSSFPALKKRINNGEIAGFCDPRFERVAQEFERNFQQRDELGASAPAHKRLVRSQAGL